MVDNGRLRAAVSGAVTVLCRYKTGVTLLFALCCLLYAEREKHDRKAKRKGKEGDEGDVIDVDAEPAADKAKGKGKGKGRKGKRKRADDDDDDGDDDDNEEDAIAEFASLENSTFTLHPHWVVFLVQALMWSGLG